jgi:hypothetical protein
MPDPKSQPTTIVPRDRESVKKARLAKALRENLVRRKARDEPRPEPGATIEPAALPPKPE